MCMECVYAMCVCMNVRMCVCLHMHVRMHEYVYVSACTCACMYSHNESNVKVLNVTSVFSTGKFTRGNDISYEGNACMHVHIHVHMYIIGATMNRRVRP